MTIAGFRRLFALCCAFSCISLLAEAGEGQTLFTDVTEEIGVSLMASRSTGFGDYDNDGWPDLFCTEFNLIPRGRVALLHNEGNGKLAERTDAIQVDLSPNSKGGGAIFGDYDNDGDLDLFVPVGSWRFEGHNKLLRNDRGTFVDVTGQAGLDQLLPTDNAIWLDYDSDGFLDLYTGNLKYYIATLRNRLYRNNGDGTFTDATGETGLDLQMGHQGGSNGGMVARDFNGDGWPDLYLGVYEDPNRLFLNDGKGNFLDATTNEISHPGEAFGVAAGDIENDGDSDIFLAAGGGSLIERSVLLLNLGEGAFLDVTESVGLAALGAQNLLSPNLADIDNDGDLDLLIANPGSLFLNKGGGTFEDGTSQWGVSDDVGGTLSLGDYNRDGFLDVWFGDDNDIERPPYFGRLYRNNGNGNHWLQVELAGVESNRNGIGARLWVYSGEHRQMREMAGGNGYYQDEMVAHFGLGDRTQVDRLEIHWPSGQEDVLTDIPADQRIRVIEGQGKYHETRPVVWESALPGSLVVGSSVDCQLSIRPVPFEPDAEITRVTADLSALGGSETVPLTAFEDGIYRLESVSLAIEPPNGPRTISVLVDQETSLGSYWTRLSRTLAVLPSEDLVLFGDMLGEGWEWASGLKVELDAEATTHSHQGTKGLELRTDGNWRVTCLSAEPIDITGYDALRFAIHPGDASGTALELTLVGFKRMSLFSEDPNSAYVDMEDRSWQVIEIPLSPMGPGGALSSIIFSGRLRGTLYLDDIRLVATTPPPLTTAVTGTKVTSLPQSFILDQNYPNPFNSATVIRFALPTAAGVDLAIFNLAGQRVAMLVEGAREAGTYTVRWDGRDDDGRALASGVYV